MSLSVILNEKIPFFKQYTKKNEKWKKILKSTEKNEPTTNNETYAAKRYGYYERRNCINHPKNMYERNEYQCQRRRLQLLPFIHN